jgi:hypothetical protein
VWAAACALGLSLTIPVSATHQKETSAGSSEKYTAMAVNMGVPGPGAAGQVEIGVDRWSSDAERDQLMNTLVESGPTKLLSTLQKLPRMGYIRTPNSVGYDVHYARKYPYGPGGERVVLITDRVISFWELSRDARTLDYPFTLIELRLGADGKGEGKMSIATKITFDKEQKTVELEDYQSQPVLLQGVSREK